jgi:hypothetical protein
LTNAEKAIVGDCLKQRACWNVSLLLRLTAIRERITEDIQVCEQRPEKLKRRFAAWRPGATVLGGGRLGTGRLSGRPFCCARCDGGHGVM